MKTGRSRKYYLMEAVLILFNILINLIIFAVPLAVNQIINGKLALTDRVPDGAGRLDGAHIGESVYYVGPDTDCKITGYFVDPVILPDHQYFYFSGDAVYLDTQCGWILYPE